MFVGLALLLSHLKASCEWYAESIDDVPIQAAMCRLRQ